MKSAASESGPATINVNGDLCLERVGFIGSVDAFDVTIKNQRITETKNAQGPADWLCLPPLADLHVHANRAYTPPAVRPKGLRQAAQMAGDVFASFSVGDYQRHAEQLLSAAYRKGTTRVRTHADINSSMQLDAVIGSLRAAQEWSDKIDVDVVAFAGASADPATANGRALLREAILGGAHYLGAVPAFCSDQAASINAILDLALELSVPVDLHLDEHLDIDQCFSEYLAKATIDRGLHSKVTLSHACAISALAPADRARVVERLAEAEITVIALPRTNLYLQDAGDVTPTLRGITCVKEMVEAGVAVRFASDNVRDVFYPYGDADLLGVAMDGILATQLDDPRAVVETICCGRSSFKVGDAAEMVIVAGSGFDEIVAEPPNERWLLRSGVVSRTC